MAMTSRERMLTALSNGRPDRLPCQVHGWMEYYLRTYLGDMDWYHAFERFGMDYAIYVSPAWQFDPEDQAKWVCDRKTDNEKRCWEEQITTPEGTLFHKGEWNEFTPWETEELVKTQRDFELWDKYCPVPVSCDMSHMFAAKERLGDNGIIRCHPCNMAGQGSPWQALCILMGTEPAIMAAMDDPDFVHHALDRILQKTLKTASLMEGVPADMIETGGGAGSDTVISPRMFKEFCLPYDKVQHKAFADLGLKIVYHLCGGVMHMLELVAQNGAHGLETMTPPSMGGNCDLREASRLVGDRLFFIGGFDQNAGFEKGTPETAKSLVRECFEATRDHAGYIIAPSDHFFFGDPENLQAFADAAKECVY
ncbi:MAG: hypothetical protein ILO36_03185 [Abditibacteriota bacterium]|nr:hypothetical protein [Abditibacteriota bacterium]